MGRGEGGFCGSRSAGTRWGWLGWERSVWRGVRMDREADCRHFREGKGGRHLPGGVKGPAVFLSLVGVVAVGVVAVSARRPPRCGDSSCDKRMFQRRSLLSWESPQANPVSDTVQGRHCLDSGGVEGVCCLVRRRAGKRGSGGGLGFGPEAPRRASCTTAAEASRASLHRALPFTRPPCW